MNRQAARSTIARQRARKKNLTFTLYVLPALVFFFLFKYWPMIYSLFLSFYKWNFVSSMKFIGWENYTSMFTKTVFVKGLTNTFSYILALLPFFVVLPMLFSVMLLSVRRRGAQDLYKTFFFIPTILAFSIICLVWMWMFNPDFGLLNNLLKLFGHGGYSWLSEKGTAFWSIVMVSGWKYIGSNIILFMAGLLTISQDCLEAATIDGANGWQAFWRIKFPLLSPTTVYMIITSIIFAAERAFTPINLMTNGGPANTTANLSSVIYEFGFRYFNIGLASATAMFTSILFLAMTVVMMKMMGGFSYYEN